ncbi:MAG: DNA mismatch repair endonuclease MutL [Candidatus Izemoplasmatales bacterium]
MGKIIKLDAKLSNMIAAGEVVEKISNVVKELVENSIDAKATKIDVILEESGLKKIQIIDNGSGMDSDDALLAFERHATSKIANEYDLFHIRSLGFRGEALPSIASVSRVEIETSTGDEGCRLVIEDGELLEKGMGHWGRGTSITVSRLFYHTPARYKYLKSPQTELSNIVDLVNKFSMSYPEIRFSLTNNSKVMFQSSGNGNTLDILAKIYGIEVAKSMRRFSGKNRDYDITGFVSNPIQNRSNKNYISIFVNHRYIRNSKISNAIVEAYGALIPLNRYPIVYIHISVDPSLVDVNIHPTKQEIKFSEEDALLFLIKETISKKLELVEVIQPIKKAKPVVTDKQLTIEEMPLPQLSITEDELDYHVEEMKEDSYQEEKKKRQLPVLEYIGQYHGTYLLFQNNDGLFLLDQHAAAERIRYERYSKKMSVDHQTSYQLLVPQRIELSNEYITFLSDHLSEVEQFGIKLKEVNSSTYEILSIPAWFPRGYEVIYTESVLMTFVEKKTLSKGNIIDELATLLSCKHSLKANAYVSKMEAEQLYHDLNQCNEPYTCPHGRPIILSMENIEIEKWFKRVL